MNYNELTKQELIYLLLSYDEYIYNYGEEWSQDRQPIGIDEFYNNEYQEKLD